MVFVNTLYLLTEAFFAFFLGFLLPPIQFALRFKKFEIKTVHLNVKSIITFIVKVQSTATEEKKKL